MNAHSDPYEASLSADMLQSYWQWWQELGVAEDYADDAHGWLEAADEDSALADKAQSGSTAAQAIDAQAPMDAPQTRKAAAPAPSLSEIEQREDNAIALPQTLAELAQWWPNSSALKTQSGIGPRIAPTLQPSAKLLLVTDMPDEDDQTTLHSGHAGVMLETILVAIGMSREDCAFMSILPQYCADPESELTQRPFWRKLVAHQISLLQPTHVMLCSKLANIAVTGNDLAENRRSLRFINHDGRNMPASASFHPRILAATPAMKRAAWRDWLRLKGNMHV